MSDLPAQAAGASWRQALFDERRCENFMKVAGPGLTFQQYADARLSRQEHGRRVILGIVATGVAIPALGLLIKVLLPGIF